ncbi:SIR2 family protein [Sunxiuqinia indica]|uniref:SIR2 family protein n=1 Tax=Sunxiuqinia indica TaxID=2692584 RepID=UPI001356BE6A|nr:SIR2 family protein [Sunxiuqinia indica]
MKIDKIKDLIQSCHVNFLLGSGISRPFLSRLGNIEILLTKLSKRKDLDQGKIERIKSSIYKVYFAEIMWPNHPEYEFIEKKDEELKGTKEAFDLVIKNYHNFLNYLNEIMLFRYSTILNKQVNLFTTNIDLFLEDALDETGYEFNDGFRGRMTPVYDLSNFQKSYAKTSLHYDNRSEIPVFNLLKLHGSVNWKQDEGEICLSNLTNMKKVKKAIDSLCKEAFLDLKGVKLLKHLTAQIEDGDDMTYDGCFENFIKAYEKLIIVNPTKEKFERTLFDEKYYELLRIYANSLEKENAILFCLGFSFADEHIREITLRAANSNPTLQIIVFAYDSEAKNAIKKELKIGTQKPRNNNVKVIDPMSFIRSNYSDPEDIEEARNRIEIFDFETLLDEIFHPVSKRIRIKTKANDIAE